MSKLAVSICLALCMVVAVQSECDVKLLYNTCVKSVFEFIQSQDVLPSIKVQCEKMAQVAECVTDNVPSCDAAAFTGLQAANDLECGVTYNGCNLSDLYNNCAADVFAYIKSLTSIPSQAERCSQVEKALQCASTKVPGCADEAKKFAEAANDVECNISV